jgi:hypothetical protein
MDYVGYVKALKWVDPVVQKMKKGEIAVIILEHLKLDVNGMKVLDHNDYLLVQLVEFVTIIGYFGSFNNRLGLGLELFEASAGQKHRQLEVRSE